VRGAGAPRQCACTRAIVALVTLSISKEAIVNESLSK
jgi:hypothetical protein